MAEQEQEVYPLERSATETERYVGYRQVQLEHFELTHLQIERSEHAVEQVRPPISTKISRAQSHNYGSAVGYVLHPLIKDQLPSEPLVAELATGTGAWLVDLSKELSPSARFHGYDITDTAFLPPVQRPSNVALNVSDAKQPAPAQLQGKYDVVNVRFLNTALLPGEDWQKIATHAFQLLKPGGALQCKPKS